MDRMDRMANWTQSRLGLRVWGSSYPGQRRGATLGFGAEARWACEMLFFGGDRQKVG